MTYLLPDRSNAWVLLFSATWLACSGGDVDDVSPTSGGSSALPAAGGAKPITPPPASSGGQPMAGAGGGEELPPPHPLFGAGNDTGLDLSDPCLTTTTWKVDTAIELHTGSVVLYEGTVWELTGTSSETWALADCTPPGTGWCAEQYAWKIVGTCPEEAD